VRSTFFVLLVTLLGAFFAILAITVHLFPPVDIGSPEDIHEGLKTTLRNEAFLEHGLYRRDGCDAHLAMEQAGAIIKLAKATGDTFSILCGGDISPAFAGLLHKAVATQTLVNGSDGAYWVIAYPFRIRDGSQLVIAQYSLQQKKPSWKHWPGIFVPSAAAVCTVLALLLAYFFARPVRELRAVVRSFAAGNLDTRVSESRLRLAAAGTSEIRSLMIDFNQMADRINLLVNAQKLLLRDVSHELRSPLARMNVALEMARDDAPASTEVHLQRIDDEAALLNRLIGELLSLSFLESLHSPIAVEPISIVRLVERNLPNLKFEARSRDCSVTLTGDAEIKVLGNAELLSRAIENIARNAIRYSSPGTNIDLEVAHDVAGDGSNVLLRIMDRGPGIPKDMLEAVFRPFVRVDPSRSDETGGFGVGLAIAERAIHLHRGSVRALPRAGGGLSVEIILPSEARVAQPETVA
jgi:two-component system, OmpR family, sensor histidine kinase CpxA